MAIIEVDVSEGRGDALAAAVRVLGSINTTRTGGIGREASKRNFVPGSHSPVVKMKDPVRIEVGDNEVYWVDPREKWGKRGPLVLTSMHRQMMYKLLDGWSNREIAREYEVDEGSVSVIVRSPLFRSELRKLEQKIEDKVVDVATRFRNLGPKVYNAVVEMVEADSPGAGKHSPTRLAAAKLALEYGGFKPASKSEAVVKHEVVHTVNVQEAWRIRAERMKQVDQQRQSATADLEVPSRSVEEYPPTTQVAAAAASLAMPTAMSESETGMEVSNDQFESPLTSSQTLAPPIGTFEDDEETLGESGVVLEIEAEPGYVPDSYIPAEPSPVLPAAHGGDDVATLVARVMGELPATQPATAKPVRAELAKAVEGVFDDNILDDGDEPIAANG